MAVDLLTYFDITDLVDNAETLHRLATIDPLTAVHNRRHFSSSLKPSGTGSAGTSGLFRR
jgi:GGDEF domain-containing protein